MSRFDGRTIYGLTGAAFRRMAAAVSQAEVLPYDQRTKRRRRWPVGGGMGFGIVPVQIGSGGIVAGNMGSATSGPATKLKLSGSGPSFTATGGTAITAVNLYTSAIPGNAFAWCLKLFSHYYILVYNCGASA